MNVTVHYEIDFDREALDNAGLGDYMQAFVKEAISEHETVGSLTGQLWFWTEDNTWRHHEPRSMLCVGPFEYELRGEPEWLFS